MPGPAPRRWLVAALALSVFVAAALWMKAREGPRAERATTTVTRLEGVASPDEASKSAAEPGAACDLATDKAWRLEVEIQNEDGAPLKGRVYVTDAAGDLLSAQDTEPPEPLAQTVRGTINVVAYVQGYVPRNFEGLAPPQVGVRTLVAVVERGPGIEGTVADDQGVPVTIRRAPRLTVGAHPLDLPPWLSNESESWRREWGRMVFWSRPKEDGSFRIEGLPPGRYEICCDTPPGGLGMRDREPLLQVDPVLACTGDSNVRIVCVRAVELRVRFVDSETGADLLTTGCVVRWSVMEGGRCVSSGSGSVRRDLTVTARPGADLTITVEIEGYLPPEPLKLAVNGEPVRQEIALAFRRDIGSIAVLELTVHDDLGRPVYPLMVGRPLAGMAREEDHNGRYAVRLPAGDQIVRLESPSDQWMLFTREWLPSNLDPSDYVDAHAYLPATLEVVVPRNGRIAREVRMQRAAFVWIRQEPPGAFTRVRILRGGREMERGIYELYENKGLAAAVEPGTYTVEGRAEEKVVKIDVAAKAAEVAEVWLRADGAK